VTNEIKTVFEDKMLSMSQVHGRDFALASDGATSDISVIPMKSKSIALNQHYGFAHNNLFLQETSLLRDLVAEGIKRFANDPAISSQSADHLFNIAGLYLPSAYYIQEFEVTKWSSAQMKLNLLQFAVQKSSFTLNENNTNNITAFNAFPGVVALIILSSYLKKLKKKEKGI
jgi:hypothetical protein